MKGKGAEGAQECAVRVLLGKAQQSSSRERDRKGYAKEPRRRLERGVSDGAARDGVHHEDEAPLHENLHNREADRYGLTHRLLRSSPSNKRRK